MVSISSKRTLSCHGISTNQQNKLLQADISNWTKKFRHKTFKITKSPSASFKRPVYSHTPIYRNTVVKCTTESIESDILEAPGSNGLIEIPGQNKTDKIFIDGDIPDSVDIKDPTAFTNWLMMNSVKLQMVFLGTSCWYPTSVRNLPSVAMRTSGDTWLFDVGEDTQRQCMKHPLLRPGKISRIFLTSLNGDILFGLPGVLCTIASSRGQGAVSDQPVHVYGPKGTASFLAMMMQLSDTFLEMPVIVHEFSRTKSSMELRGLASRAKIWKMELPPDAANEQGFYNARLNARRPLKRNVAKPGRRSAELNTIDFRANFRPFQLPPPGDPTLDGPISSEEAEWTLMVSPEYLVKVYEIDEETSSFAYRIEEATKSGNLDVDKAKALGVAEGRDFGVLKEGGSIITGNGVEVKSEMVVSPDRPGRTVTVIGEIAHSNKAERAARNADYLLTPVGQHSGHDKCISPTQALSLAKSASVKNLIFSRINTRAERILEEIEECGRDPDIKVTTAFDLYTFVASNPY